MVWTSSGTDLLLPRATVHMNNTQPNNNTGAPTYWRRKGAPEEEEEEETATLSFLLLLLLTTLSYRYAAHLCASILYGILSLFFFLSGQYSRRRKEETVNEGYICDGGLDRFQHHFLIYLGPTLACL